MCPTQLAKKWGALEWGKPGKLEINRLSGNCHPELPFSVDTSKDERFRILITCNRLKKMRF
jgi:hypothetical protein